MQNHRLNKIHKHVCGKLLKIKSMKSYSVLKKITIVFHSHGIDLTGRKKYVNLNRDLKMNENFVMWLIYELELVCNAHINDLEVKYVQTPLEIIERLVAKIDSN